MKKTVLFLFAMALSISTFAQFKAMPAMNMAKANGAKSPYLLQWELMNGNAFTALDIDSNTVNLQADYFDNMKFTLVLFTKASDNLGWAFAQSGMLNFVNDSMGDFASLMVEVDPTNTTDAIRGIGSGTAGNWTMVNGAPVHYPIIDDDATQSIFSQFQALSLDNGNQVPDLMLVAPNGMYCNVTVYLYSYAFDPTTGEVNMDWVEYLLTIFAQNYPTEWDTPQVEIDGESAGRPYEPVTFYANYNSYSTVTSVSWNIPDGTPSTGTGDSITVSFDTTGVHLVILGVTNAFGTSYDTLEYGCYVTPDNCLSYTFGRPYTSSIGAGSEIFWAASFPPEMLEGRNSVEEVQCYVNSSYATTYTMSIYSGTATAPVTLKASVSQRVAAADADQMVTFTPNNLVPIDQTQTLWVVMSANAAYPASGCASVGEPNSDWISVDGRAWAHASDYDLNYSWLIDCYTSEEQGVGIRRLSNNVEMSIYPNPASDKLTVTAEGLREVNVLDLAGRTVATSTTNVVDLTSLSAGSYIVRVVTNEGTASKKFVKE